MFLDSLKSRLLHPSAFLIFIIYFAYILLHVYISTSYVSPYFATTRSTDYAGHTRKAEAIADTNFRGYLPHRLLHWTVIALQRFVPFITDFSSAMIAAVSLAHVSTVLITHILYIRRVIYVNHPIYREFTGLFISTLLTLVWGITLFQGLISTTYFEFFVPNAFHSPTVIFVKPFSLLLFFYLARLFHQSSFGNIAIGIILTTLTVLAKPTYTVVYLPVLYLLAGLALLRKRWVNLDMRGLILGFIMPATLILGIQFFSRTEARSGGLAIAPFSFVKQHSIAYFAVIHGIFLSLAYPMVVYLLNFSEARKNKELNLAWLIMLSAALVFHFLNEPNRLGNGNYTWGAQTAIFILFVVTTKFVLSRFSIWVNAWQERNLSVIIAGMIIVIIFSLHFISGYQIYHCQFELPDEISEREFRRGIGPCTVTRNTLNSVQYLDS